MMSTTNLLKIATGGVIAMIAIGCGYGYPVGSLYTGTQVPHGINRNETSGPGKTGDKHGEACATGILGAAAFGDASLDAAKKAGGITEIHSVEFHGTSILGIYTQGCTEVHGK
jgi:TRL-like protein family